MRFEIQVSAVSIVALGHFNPLIFRPSWLEAKEIVIGGDKAELAIEIVHPEVVALKVPWGKLQVDRDRFSILTEQEPTISAFDFFVKSFQALPETPVRAVGINREVHFSARSREAYDRIGDALAPKAPWGDFAWQGEQRTAGLRSLIMEQAIGDGVRKRLDGRDGWKQVRVEPSVRNIPYGVFVQVNDHFELAQGPDLSTGKSAANIVAEKWEDCVKESDRLIGLIMDLADAS